MVSRLVSGLRSWVLGVRCWVLGLPKAPPFPRAVRPRPTTRGLKVWHRAVDHVLVVMAYQFVSQTRDLWPDQSDEVCPSKQYRRGQAAFSRQRVVTVLFHARESTFGCALGFLMPGDGRKLTELALEVGRLLNGLGNRFQSPVEPGLQILRS
jgi:hypothetical protein